ncbi:MAG: 3-phosphoshikimate 1-carboxyvinyltransferase [Desulfamplus sp.]|nr:3-phosphoshikimate 1-carboxyvinyltransferase [Desulfamplus sp.]
MKSISKKELREVSIRIPGSKSISHRMLICASLASGTSTLKNLLDSEDINHTMSALSRMGAVIKKEGGNREKLSGKFKEKDFKYGEIIEVTGFNGKPCPLTGKENLPGPLYRRDISPPPYHGSENEIYLGNSGTSMRLLAGIAGLGSVPFTLTGDERMQERPMGDLLDALEMAGVHARSIKGDGTPPVLIKGGGAAGGSISLDCSESSQYLSAMLMMGALLPRGLDITLSGKLVSAPYVDITMNIMDKFGVQSRRINDALYHVDGGQSYLPGDHVVEPDISNASYFWAAGALGGKMITVMDIDAGSLQGDKRLLEILAMMGCDVVYAAPGIGVKGPGNGHSLRAVEVDMSDIPDVVPTLAVVASFARGTTKIVNIAHLREKECDRISAVVSQLRKMGVQADEGDDWLSVTGTHNHRGAVIETFNDHRIAMAFSVAASRLDGMVIENEKCVAKSFPGYWEKFESLGR